MPTYDYSCNAESCEHAEERIVYGTIVDGEHVSGHDRRHDPQFERACPVEGCDGTLRCYTIGSKVVYHMSIERQVEVERSHLPGDTPPVLQQSKHGPGIRRYPGYEGGEH